MQPEHKVLAAVMVDREAYDMMADYMVEQDFTAPGWVILQQVRGYYKVDKKASSADPDIVMKRIGRKLNNIKALETFKETLASLPYDLGAKNIAQELLEHKREGAASRLEHALAPRSGTDNAEIRKLLDEYGEIHDATDLGSLQTFEEYNPDVYDMFKHELSDENKIGIAPKVLNDFLGGGAFPGHCIIVFGRVEMGKSLFAINASVGFVHQGHRTVYIENEDTVLDTRRRFIQRLLKRDREWCRENPQKTKEMALAKGLDLFHLIEEPSTAADVEAAIKQYNPTCVVINQMRNMVTGDNQVSKLDTLAHALRKLGKKHRVVMLLVTAAREGDVDRNGMVRPKQQLEVGDLYMSRTGIPGAADALLGWGGSDAMKRNEQAVINVVKNKLVDGYKPGHLYVTVDPRTGFIGGGGNEQHAR